MVLFSTMISSVGKLVNLTSINVRYVYLVAILAAVWLRGYLPGEYPFGFDQVQIAENSQKIFSGDLVLIGPRTGPASMFTGPLIYYIAAPFQAFLSDPYVVVAAALTTSFLTGLIIFVLSRKYLEKKTAIIYFTLWAISPLVFWFDRVPWNPNLTILAASLVFLPLFAKKFTFMEALFIAGGVFLGYQAHFSGLFLLPLGLLSVVYMYRKQFFFSIWGVLIPTAFGVSLVPTILFDLRHNWLNFSGFFSLISNKDAVSDYWLASRFFQKIFIVIETIGKIVIAESVQKIHVSVGLFFLLAFVYLIRSKKLTRSYLLPLLWAFFVTLAFAFYRSSTPEYYFFILIPPILLIISTVVSQITYKWLSFIGVLFLIYILWGFSANLQPNKGFRIAEQLQTADFIQKYSLQPGIREVVFDVTAVDSEGVRYLLSQKNIQTTPLGAVVHIQYPHTNSLLESEKYADDMAVWIDSRTNPSQEYLITDHFLITYPTSVELYETQSPTQKRGAEIAYVLFYNQQKVAVIHFFDKQKSRDNFEKIKNAQEQSSVQPINQNNWISFDQKQYFQENGSFGIVLTHLTEPTNNMSQFITLVLKD